MNLPPQHSNDDIFIFVILTVSTMVCVELRPVSQSRKLAIDEFAHWCFTPFESKEKEKEYGLRWVKGYIDKRMLDSCQWAVFMGKYGTKFVLETLYNSRLVKGTYIQGQKACWYDIKYDRHFDVMVRSWTTPGSVGQKGLGVAYELLQMGKPVEIINVAFQDQDALQRLNLYRSKYTGQQRVLDVFVCEGIKFVSIRSYLAKLGYVPLHQRSRMIQLN